MIKICGHKELELVLSQEPGKYNVILYTNSDMSVLPVVRHRAKTWTHLPVDDVDHFEYRSYCAPKPEDIKNALAFSEDKEDLICACHAGISRSSATAYLIGSKKLGAESGLNILQEQHYPNRLIVWMGAKILQNPLVWDKFVDWQKHNRQLDPSQNGGWPPSSVVNKIVF